MYNSASHVHWMPKSTELKLVRFLAHTGQNSDIRNKSQDELKCLVERMEKEQAERWAKFTITYSKDKVDVTRGLLLNWYRTFKDDTIWMPEGWTSSLLVNHRPYTFAFVFIRNGTNIQDGSYMMVMVQTNKVDEVKGVKFNKFILHTGFVLRPSQMITKPTTVADYLKTHAVDKWTDLYEQSQSQTGKWVVQQQK